jgi:MoaA/NifB/PqqE/SkfB family radical SAM enzyme
MSSGIRDDVAVSHAKSPAHINQPNPPAANLFQNLRDAQLNVYNFGKMRAEAPATFGTIRFDPNNTCNLRCVYCHNHRSDETIDSEEFRSFLQQNVVSTVDFQFGCIMEPTLDDRLADLMLAVSQSPAKPTNMLMLQTNGTLLHRHDLGKMRAAGLTHLFVSVDAADPDTQRELRSGTSLQRVIRNVATFTSGFPEASLAFITTVTASNFRKLSPLVSLGIELGVGLFIFRELFYDPKNSIVDHARMPGLLLRGGDFEIMRNQLTAEFGNRARLVFSDEPALIASDRKMRADSLRE